MQLIARFTAALAAALLAFVPCHAADTQAPEIRWDIISFVPPDVNAGGTASAQANDRSQITLTGSGTFVVPERGHVSSNQVTGGGTWATYTPAFEMTGSGTYTVTELLAWEESPGTFSGVNDNIGNPPDARAGLITLRVAYSDGTHGVLIVSCHISGAVDAIFEGVIPSKGFIQYWNRVAPVVGIDAGRTLLHAQ